VESKQEFSSWIKKRLESLGAIDKEDYLTIDKKVNRQILKEYIVTIDIAKHLAMMERNKKGKEARQYFISIEDKYFKALETAKKYMQNGYKLQISQRNKKIENLKNDISKMKNNQIEIIKQNGINPKVFELIEKGLKYDELLEENKRLDTTHVLFESESRTMINKALKLQEELGYIIPALVSLKENGAVREGSFWTSKV
jgi:phage anti-repressor protein